MNEKILVVDDEKDIRKISFNCRGIRYIQQGMGRKLWIRSV